MYCTGGVRCEIASKLLKKELDIVDDASEPKVFQLEGGIENYFKSFGDGGHWNGANFVFDKREAFSVESGPEGVGGVVKKQKKSKTNSNNNGDKGGDENGSNKKKVRLLRLFRSLLVIYHVIFIVLFPLQD